MRPDRLLPVRTPARRKPAITRSLAVGLAGGLAAVTLAACGGDDGGEAGVAGEAPEEITLAVRNDVDTFDPALSAYENGASQIYEALYDTLVRIDLGTGDYVPAIASSWESTATTADFVIKKDLTCSDGSPLKPSDVAASIERLADPDTGSVLTGRMFGAAGVKKVTADDEASTLSIELNGPHIDMLDGLRSAFIVCPSGLEDTEKLATVPSGSGPYKLTKSTRGDSYELERWDSPAVEADATLPQRITMKVVTADSTRANLFETDAADIVSVVGRDAARLAEEHEPVKGRGNGTESLMFNQRPGRPGAELEVRQAVAQALDAEGYVKAASFGVADPINTMLSPSMQCYDESNGEHAASFDVDAAKKTLADAGYGPGGKTLAMTVVGMESQNAGPEYIAEALRTIGVDVEVKNGSLAQLVGIVYEEKEPWDVVVFPMISEARSPFPMVTKTSSNLGEGGSYNFGRIKNEEYDRLVNRVSGESDEARCATWSAAEQSLLERRDVVPLQWSTADYFSKDLEFDAGYRVLNLRTIRTKG